MPATAITPTNRFWRPAVSAAIWTPSVATLTSPTRAEINAGTDLSGEIASMGAWRVTSAFLDAPDLGHAFIAQVIAQTTIEGAEMGFYESSNGVDVRGLLPRGTSGYVLLMYGGDVAGRKMNAFKVTVGSTSPAITLNEVAQIPVAFAVTAQPAENISIPA